MALRFRKSINLGGGFRINLSKAGVGYSWGVPGYRVTKTASGKVRSTYSIPGTGISYVNERRNGKKTEPHSAIKPMKITPQDALVDINSADIQEFQPAEYQDLTNKISKTIKINRISTILICFIIFAAQPLFLIVGIAGIVLKVVVHVYGKIELDYELDDYKKEAHNLRIKKWTSLNENKKMWQITQSAVVTNKKVNAGAGRNINRIPFKFSTLKPFYLKVNADILMMRLKKETLIFLPDKILIVRGLKVGAVDYDQVSIRVSDVRFIESGIVPKDAQIVDHTWQYVNKNGSPDKRFKNNRQRPVCLYGVILITSPSGLNVEIQCSSHEKAKNFNYSIGA